jgi:hypothetical protein
VGIFIFWKVFTMLVVYADETGTGGIARDGKEPAPGVYAFLACAETWDVFRKQWQSGLDFFGVKYFHFRELNPTARKEPRNPYHGWSNDKVDDFIYHMALIAGSGPVPLGGNVSQKMTVGPNLDKWGRKKLYRKVFYTFFDDFKITMEEQFPNESEKVSFIFSEITNDDWMVVLSQVIKDVRNHNPAIGEYSFIEPYSERGIPCQAADLFAFVNRQNSSNMYKDGHVRRMRILDLIIGRHAFPKSHHGYALRTIPQNEWRELVMDMRKQKKEFESQNQQAGAEKQIYYPTRDHPVIHALINGRRAH